MLLQQTISTLFRGFYICISIVFVKIYSAKVKFSEKHTRHCFVISFVYIFEKINKTTIKHRQLLTNIEDIENGFKACSFHQNVGFTKQARAVFKVDGEKILFERWHPNTPGPCLTYVREGDILNDTTFRITESYRMEDGKKTEIKNRDELYHFKEFSPKPDSTNSFIK